MFQERDGGRVPLRGDGGRPAEPGRGELERCVEPVAPGRGELLRGLFDRIAHSRRDRRSPEQNVGTLAAQAVCVLDSSDPFSGESNLL